MHTINNIIKVYKHTHTQTQIQSTQSMIKYINIFGINK
jgi:hypothetical protein